jgi:hypothetical protein
MNHIQLQSKLSMLKFFQHFGTEALCAAILEKALGPQEGFSCPHCGEVALGFVQGRSHKIFQCPTCRHQTSLILDALFQSTKLSLTIWFLGIYLISQARAGLSALALKRQLGVSYPCAWLFKFQFMQATAEREALYTLCGSVQVDGAYLGGELSGGSVDRGSENQVCFVAAVSLSEEENPANHLRRDNGQGLSVRPELVEGWTLKPFMVRQAHHERLNLKLSIIKWKAENALHVKLTPVPFIADWAKYNLSFGCTMLSDGLARFDGVTDAEGQQRAINIGRSKPKYLPVFMWLNTMLMKHKSNLARAFHALNYNKYPSRCLAPILNCFSRRFDHKTLRESLFVGAIFTSPRIDIWLCSSEASC